MCLPTNGCNLFAKYDSTIGIISAMSLVNSKACNFTSRRISFAQ